MYFISEVLFDSKSRYSQIQKLLYAILITKRKLRHYFESHPVMVMTLFPLGEVIQSQDAMKNHKVGAQVDGSGHYVCLLNGGQVLVVGRLHRGMD